MSRKIDRTSSTTSRWMSRATGEPMWRLSSQKREIVLAITVGIADQRLGQQGQAPRFPPFACPDPAPAAPALGAFYRLECGGDCGLAGSLSPRDGLALRLRREVCTAPN